VHAPSSGCRYGDIPSPDLSGQFFFLATHQPSLGCGAQEEKEWPAGLLEGISELKVEKPRQQGKATAGSSGAGGGPSAKAAAAGSSGKGPKGKRTANTPAGGTSAAASRSTQRAAAATTPSAPAATPGTPAGPPSTASATLVSPPAEAWHTVFKWCALLSTRLRTCLLAF
jgi:hypothetical protein